MVIRLGGFDKDIIVYTFYEKKPTLKFFYKWKEVKLNGSTSTVKTASDVERWGYSDFINHGMSTWVKARLESRGVNNFKRCAKEGDLKTKLKTFLDGK